MKSGSNRCAAYFSFGLGLLLFLLANSGIGQGNKVQTDGGRSNLPDLSSVSSASIYDQPGKSSEINQDTSTIDNSNPDTKTIYDKFGSTASPDSGFYGKGDHRGRITHGGKKEKMVVTESKSEGIKKTKDGSSDTTEPTGPFKSSLLDAGLNHGIAASQPSVSPSGSVNPLRAASPIPHSSILPRSESSPAPSLPVIAPGQEIDLSLGVNPGPSATASPRR
jgi:hypothetical protein